MAEFNANETKAPVYRYFTVDLMSNKVLMEIPFQGVSYERALKAAGSFSGKIPVIEKTKQLSLYETTIPGQTALYVVRNGVCVWGGIIWARDYSVKEKTLQVSASEFTSYFHHRLIWKTVNFQYGASIDVSPIPVQYTETYRYNSASNASGFANYILKDANGNTQYGPDNNPIVLPYYFSTVGTTGTGATFRAYTDYTNVGTYPAGLTNVNSAVAYPPRLTFGTSATVGSGIRYTNPVNAGQQYNFSAYVASSMANTMRLRVTFANSAGTTVGSTSSGSDKTVAASITSWQQLVLSGVVAPTGATQVFLDVYNPAGTAWTSGALLQVVAVRVAPTTITTDLSYFDGNTKGIPYTLYSWDGGSSLSSSTETTQQVNYSAGGGTTTVTLDNGTAKDIVVGAKVEVEFYEPENFPYNGYYKVIERDSPSASTFVIDSAVTANIVSIGNPGFPAAPTNYYRVYVVTDGPHGFSTGDTVTISGAPVSYFNGVWTVRADDGPSSSGFWYVLPTRSRTSGNTTDTYPKNAMKDTYGAVAARYLPTGASFDNVTISVHTDTYDYIRGLINSVWDDFAEIEFADEYLTPGVDVSFRILSSQLNNGYATITTSEPHGLVVGQSVTISELGSPYNGSWVVAGIPSSTSFSYELSGVLPLAAVSVPLTSITSRYIADGVAYITYNGNPTYLADGTVVKDRYNVGDKINIPQMEDFDGLADVFTGDHIIEYHPKAGVVGWSTSVPVNSSPSTPTVADMTVLRNITYPGGSGNTYVSYGTPVGYSLTNGILNIDYGSTLLSNNAYSATPQVGDRVVASMPYAMPVTQKSIDAPNLIKSIETSRPHNLSVGDLVNVSGDSDTYSFKNIQYKTDNTFTLTTNTPHNIRKGQSVLLRNVMDTYTDVKLVGISGNAALVVVNGGNHNVTYPYWYGGSLTTSGGTTPVSGDVDNIQYDFSNFYSYFSVKSITVKNNVATLTTQSSNTFLVNDTVTLSGLSESAKVVSKEIRDGIIILTTDGEHNFQVSDEITVTGLGSPYNTISGRSTVVLSVTETRILYQYQDANGNGNTNLNASPTTANGTVKTSNSTLNGSFVVTSKPSASQLTFSITANDISTRTYAANSGVDVGGESILKKASTIGYSYDSNGTPIGVQTVTIGTDNQRTLRIPLAVPNVPNISGNISLGNSRDTTIEKAEFKTVSPVSDEAARFRYVQTSTNGSTSYGWSVVSATQYTFTCQWFPHTPANYPNDTVFWPTNPNSFGNVPVSQFRANTVGNAGGIATAPSAVAGDFLVTEVVSDYRVNAGVSVQSSVAYTTQPVQNVLETSTSNSAYFRMSSGRKYAGPSGGYTNAATAVSGQGTLSSIDYTNNTIAVTLDDAKSFGSAIVATSYSNQGNVWARNGNKVHKDIPYQTVATSLYFTKTPVATISTYGPFPGNANLGMTFSTSQYSGIDVTPTAYRGYAMTNVGDALDAYSGTTNGFEYRIDCSYDADRDEFSRTFVLIPIDFPNPPNSGEVSDPSRFGADKLVFEYPGNVIDVKLQESAENSATRFFAVGDANLGEDTADPYSAASSLDLLNADSLRKWPLLDDHENIKDVTDKNILGTFAEQYLNEARPPEAEFTVSVNGSLQPNIESYLPGNWCSIIVKDDFIQDRLKSNLEPRDTVLVRKIDSYKVAVPDGITFPETIDLTLVAEWDVDKKAT